MAYDALLLDYDGVIVEVLDDDQRLPLFRDSLQRELHEDGLAVDDLVERFVHSVTYEELQAASERTGVDPDRLWRSRDDAIAEALTTAAREGQKGPYDDVAALSSVDVPMGVASNNQQRVVEAITAEHDLDHLFESMHARSPTPESLRRKKPNPLFVERARAAVGAENPLYVGDRGKDIVAGQRAGMDTALLRREHTRGRAFDVDPTYEVAGLPELVDILSTKNNAR
jgi:phosphoglycolate phosphatase